MSAPAIFPVADLVIDLPLPGDTDRLGSLLAQHLRAGDTVLLSGPIGAGKTHLARALIRHSLGRMEDVPSPTFTLVQTYDATGPQGLGAEIWHADLYRLSMPDEVVELGLEAAFDTAICLIEWPDRLGDLAPKDALRLTLEPAGDGRRATLAGGRAALRDSLARGIAEW